MKRYANKKISDLYDNYAKLIDSCYSIHGKLITKITRIKSDYKIYEIGSGTGETTKNIISGLNSEGLLVSSEPDELMRSRLRKNLKPQKNFKILSNKSEEHPEIKSKFDIIIGNFVILHIDISKTLKVAGKILNPKGKVILSDFSIIIDYQKRKKDFYDYFEKDLKSYAEKNNLEFNSPFSPKYTSKDLRLITKSNGFKLSYKTIYRTENHKAISQGMNLFSERNFFNTYPSLTKEKSIKIVKSIFEKTYKKRGSFKYGVIYLIFEKE